MTGKALEKKCKTRKKRKYQEKYRKMGKAKEASEKFNKKCIEEDKESFKKVIKQDKCKNYNREVISKPRKNAKQMRLRKFNKFCSQCFDPLPLVMDVLHTTGK